MSLADQFKPTVDNLLGTLDGLLAKAADNGGDTLLTARIAPDMHPLAAQVRIACDQVSTGLKRLSDSQFTLPDDDDVTIAAARERIAKARAAAVGQADNSFVGADAPVEFGLPNGMTFGMTGAEYTRDWVIAQLYFHVVAAYMILRKEGVAVGKADFVPHMFRHIKSGPTPA